MFEVLNCEHAECDLVCRAVRCQLHSGPMGAHQDSHLNHKPAGHKMVARGFKLCRFIFSEQDSSEFGDI